MSRASRAARWRRLPHPLRWIGAAIGGGACILVGVVLLVLPGPGIALIVVGLLILATEFAWAESLLQRLKRHGAAVTSTVSDRIGRTRRSTP
ncbi:MAG: PGPGW domain-containing protein [Actinomycetota bacterium]|nr:PGPGW domain-containing protein [Actinomycetota bacterium]